MQETLLFNASLKRSEHVDTFTLAFIHQHHLDFSEFLSHLKVYFQENIIPNHLVILAGNYLKNTLEEKLSASEQSFRDVIPTRYYQQNLFTQFISVYLFDEYGSLELLKGSDIFVPDIATQIFRIGLTNIFVKGGVISSQSSHHFVFPSGKHCNKFLRTGNVLIKSKDIFFIAFNLLRFYKQQYEIIYCDTSSINSLAFALIELKRRLATSFRCPYVESYGSYKGFEETEFVDRHKAFFLISSSTSANIIDRLKLKKIEEHQIVLVYCLNAEKYQHLVVCDLAKDELNPGGIEPFETYPFNQKCSFCNEGSMPVPVQGDVFLLERPQVNRLQVTVNDAPTNLSAFVKSYYHKTGSTRHFFRSNYFESSVRSSASAQFAYEIFLDIESIFEDLKEANPLFKEFRDKIDRHIYQYLPSNTKFIIPLNDAASNAFAEYLKENLSEVVRDQYIPKIVPVNEIPAIPVESKGAAVIVCSSMVSGGNLIYVSKEMRKFESLSLIYLVGITRTSNESDFKTIKNNLTQGVVGINTHSFYSLETIHCNSDYKNTAWLIEQEFVRTFLSFCDDVLLEDGAAAIEFFQERDKLLANSLKSGAKGLTNDLFYRNIYNGQSLKINKNFAFFKFHGYDQSATQADIFFTISAVLNKLRYSKDLKRQLVQSEYVRNILDPSTFERFNDGIIQAALLRSAHPLELAYDLDQAISKKFVDIMVPIVIHAKTHYGEALMEFLYAIAIKKVRVQSQSLVELLAIIEKKCSDQAVVNSLCKYIRMAIIERDSRVLSNYTILYEFS